MGYKLAQITFYPLKMNAQNISRYITRVIHTIRHYLEIKTYEKALWICIFYLFSLALRGKDENKNDFKYSCVGGGIIIQILKETLLFMFYIHTLYFHTKNII